jgi:hypothetical protein
MSAYEDTLSPEQLRREVRELWDREAAFERDLNDLPEVPSMETLRLLSCAGMGTHNPDCYWVGKQIQRFTEAGKSIPWKTEYECAAGLWALIRAGIIGPVKIAPLELGITAEKKP